MREVEGIQEALDVLEPHWPEIIEAFDQANERFKGLMSVDHDPIGRVLKCHLVVERYIEDFLVYHFRLENLPSSRLSFYQKASLLPDHSSGAAFVKPGIMRLNAIRNHLGHDLDVDLEEEDLTPIDAVINISRPDVAFPGVVEKIEAFTTVACTFLIVGPSHVREVFEEAFSNLRLPGLGEDGEVES